MLQNNKRHICIISTISFCIFFHSCKKFVQVSSSPNQITSTAVFMDSTDATGAVLGMYVNAMSDVTILQPLNGLITISTGLSADELAPTNKGAQSDFAFYQNALSSTTGNGYLFWNKGYQFIYQANACIEGLTGSSGITQTAKNQLIGESKVFRALNYFNIVSLYGDAPLVLTTGFATNSTLKRSPVTDIFNQIVTDLSDAESLLGINYVTSGRARINQYTATALLSKVYIYLGRWSDAEKEASKIIQSTIYSLEGNLNNVFLAGSNEAIWQMIPLSQGFETAEGFAFLPADSTVIPPYIISDYLLKDFESGDLRRSNWIDSNIVNGVVYYYPYKYKLGADGAVTPVEDYMVFRLGEQYLIRAEARAQLGNLSGATSDLNKIRNRANLPNTSALTQNDLLSAIYKERRIELFCEWGNRWYDIKRTGQANAIMSVVTPHKGGIWNADWQLYPIALSEIALNPALKQNPGY